VRNILVHLSLITYIPEFPGLSCKKDLIRQCLLHFHDQLIKENKIDQGAILIDGTKTETTKKSPDDIAMRKQLRSERKNKCYNKCMTG